MKVNREFLMTAEEGYEWNNWKASLGPLYPGYENFDIYMNWMKERLSAYGCIDIKEHHWAHETYRVDDWPDHESGALGLVSDGSDVPVGTFLMLSSSTGKDGLTAPMIFYDASLGKPERGVFQGKIVVMETAGHPEKPFDEKYLESFVVTDTNFRSDPKPPAPMFEVPDPSVSNSWNTRWDFNQWRTFLEYALSGSAAGMIIVSKLTYGCLRGLYDRQRRHDIPCIVVDREAGKKVVLDAKNGKIAKLTLISRYYMCDAWNFVCFLPGKNYGTPNDEYITINVHTDAMSLTQDNGSLGALGIARYFSHIPQSLRGKTLLFCIDCRHFIEGYEFGNIAHDPYKVYPELVGKITATVGLEHMGELEGAEDYENNTMVCTGLPEYTFMKADDNDYCSRILIEAAVDSGLERADVKIAGRPGIHGMFKGMVRAVQASCHKLGVCEIGQAGNWPGAHTQTFSGMQYFSKKKFHDEVYVWTQVVGCMMETDSIVYDIMWSDLNTSVRSLYSQKFICAEAKEGLLGFISSVFAQVESGEYLKAASRLKDTFPDVLLTLIDKDTAQPALDAAELVYRKLISRSK